MIKGKVLKHVAVLTFFFFIYAALIGNIAVPGDKDILLKARMLIREGDFEAAVKELYDVIEKLKTIISQKRNLAEAHYLLARVYKIVQMEDKFKDNLKMAFKIYPHLSMEEPDPETREMVRKIKTELEKDRIIEKEEARKKKKKKFPVLLAAAGVAVVIAAVLLLKKKKESDTTDTSNYDTAVLGIQWVDIPAGEFPMGDNFNDGWTDERPVHTVYLDAYEISRYEVTFEQYDTFCDDTGRNKPDDNGWGRDSRPVIHVSWDDASAFCNWLSGKTGQNIHLPTEAQWEKAARGTDQRKYPWGNDAPSCDMTNYNNCLRRTMPVGSYPSSASPYGVHDMAGNAWEWCSDWYDSSYYSNSPTNNPTGPAGGTQRVHRGGSWVGDGENIRTPNRESTSQSHDSARSGFRICRN